MVYLLFLVRNILEEVKSKKLINDFKIIYVDDGSKDGTFDILDEFSQKDLSVKSLSFSRNFEHQAALSAGLKFLRGDAVISLDADSVEILIKNPVMNV